MNEKRKIAILGDVRIPFARQHTRDFHLTRESMRASGLAPRIPAYDVQQACATSLEKTLLLGNKIGHHFAATGAGIVATAAKQLALHRASTGLPACTLISVCAAGGLDVTAIPPKPERVANRPAP